MFATDEYVALHNSEPASIVIKFNILRLNRFNGKTLMIQEWPLTDGFQGRINI